MLSASNQRVTKNTAVLSFRMLFTMGVTLYTSRIVLNVLGVENYGIYNVVGGIVILLTFSNGAMLASSSRFLAFELGKNDYDQLKKTFSAALTIHFIIAFIIFILAETVGLWFVLNKLVIPSSRLNASIWVYQFSILSCIISLIQVPYNASIIAHERMNIYAYFSILDVSLKLAIVFLIKLIDSVDKLILYSFLILCTSIIVIFAYKIYCKYQYEECSYHFHRDKTVYTKLINFSGWSLLGNFSWTMLTEGTNILLNLFFGPVVNAAQAIASQVNSAVLGFVYNFRTAVNPQIIKLYAINEQEKMFVLYFQSCKFSYFIILLLTFPILLETNFVLHVWLKTVPDYTILLIKLTLVYSLVSTFDSVSSVILQAVGRLKETSLINISSTLFVIFPLTFILFKWGYKPYVLYYTMIFKAFIFSFIITPLLLYKIAHMKIKDYITNVIIPTIKVTCTVCILPILLVYYFKDNVFRFLLICSVSSVSVIMSVLYVGMEKETRKEIFLIIKNKLRRHI